MDHTLASLRGVGTCRPCTRHTSTSHHGAPPCPLFCFCVLVFLSMLFFLLFCFCVLVFLSMLFFLFVCFYFLFLFVFVFLILFLFVRLCVWCVCVLCVCMFVCLYVCVLVSLPVCGCASASLHGEQVDEPSLSETLPGSQSLQEPWPWVLGCWGVWVFNFLIF